MKVIFFLLGYFCLWIKQCTSYELFCKNKEYQIDWYFMIKPPASTSILYADKSKPEFVKCGYNVTNTSNPVAVTLQPVYDKEKGENISYFLFNDEVPYGQVSFNQGHTKGVVLFNNKTVVYIAHSVPHYPYNDTDIYGYPHTGIKYGQHFFCMTFGIEELPKLLYQVRMMWPFVYNYKILPNAFAKYQILNAIINNIPFAKTENKNSSVAELKMTDGTNLGAYNKNGTYGKDIYDDLISKSFTPPLSLFSETWQNGKSKLPSYCAPNYFVKNIKMLNFEEFSLEFKETQDHSKWAISANGGIPYLCFGGVNRMASQFRRGGGMYCFYNEQLWVDLNGTISQLEEC